jgi:predicted TIM-barrel fold metal-dependent hydrolase
MTVTRHFQRIISADSHFMEPYDLWWNPLGKTFGDRTPRVLEDYQGRPGRFFYSGNQGRPVAPIRDSDPETEAALVEAEGQGMAACGYDPAVRVRFQEEALIEAEVMNPTRMLGIMRNPDVEVVQACAQVYNDWAAEFVSHSPRRFVGVSVIPMNEVEWAIKELQRTLKKGLRNPMINCQAPEGCPPYRDSLYDPFWAAASEADAPVTLHVLTGRVLSPLGGVADQTPEERHGNPALWIDLFNEIQTVLANDFIFGGILERFPKLKVVCGEYEVSWIPGFMARLDTIDANLSRFQLPKLAMPASDYMRTRVFHGFISDTAADYSIPHVGPAQVIWGSDFPHFRSIGLDAQSALHELVGALPRDDQEKVVGGNAARVFNLD